MAFKTKEDVYGLTAISGIELVGTTENKTAQTVEAQGENGFVVASEVFGQKSAPSNEYIIKGRNVSLGNITLGSVTTSSSKSYCINQIDITTAAGQVPTMNIAGQQIEDNAAVACTTTVPSLSVCGLHHAQTFGAFTFSGAGAHLTQSTFTAQCTINTADKDGVMLAHDITDGRMTVTGTLQVSDQSYPIPTLTATSGWFVSSPLTETNPNANYPTYTFTLTKYLTGNEPS